MLDGPYVLILHEVEDYAAWRAVFDEAAGIRKAAGELSFQVLAHDGDANRIVHFARWRSLERARVFFAAQLVRDRHTHQLGTPSSVWSPYLYSR